MLGACAPATDEAALVPVRRAQATLRPDGAPPQQRRVELRHRWDSDFPGRSGSASYRVDLPPAAPGTPRAVLFDRVGNEATVRFLGPDAAADAQRLGHWSTSGGDAGKHAHMLRLPHAATALQIDVKAEALRDAGLSALWVGPPAAIDGRYRRRQLIDEVLPVAYATSLLLMGGLAAGLWARQRELLYGCFSLAALCGAVRHLDRLLPEAPVPWPVWGAVLAIAYGVHLALIGRFVLFVTGRTPRWLQRAFLVILALIVGLAALSFASATPAFWTGALALQLCFGLVCFVFVLRQAIAQRRAAVWWVLATGSLLLAAGVHDLLGVRTTALGGSREPLSPHALFFFVLLLAGIVVQRYNASVAEARALNLSLAERVAERERQLAQAFDTMRVQREQQAALQERQRIMRDIHDGVGSQLVGLLSLVRQPRPNAEELLLHVNAALDELRIAVDALQPVHGDLSTVLATLRYRLQPRLQAAGIRIAWDVPSLPLLADLPPQSVLQIQRILLEAFTNVIRHAHASVLTVSACISEVEGTARLRLTVADNGVGLPEAGASPGQGLRSMQARAQAIGAQLHVRPHQPTGTCVELDWPLEPHLVPPANAGGAGPDAHAQ